MLLGSAPAEQSDPSLGGVSTLGCSSCLLPPAGFFLLVSSPACSPGHRQGGLAEVVEWGPLFSLCVFQNSPSCGILRNWTEPMPACTDTAASGLLPWERSS